MKSPFKFLDAYTPEDQAVFFGRDLEVESLYQLVFKSRLLLVYGQSGTGKTSLVQCGLGGKFDLTDWYPLFVRRQENLNQSLRDTLAEAAGGSLRQDSLPETVAWLYKNYLRPVYLIFDQLEELFILGSAEEQAEFIEGICDLIEAELPCKILLIMREEYLAQLYPFEQRLPTLMDRRLRVEPMSYAKVAEVIQGSCASFDISLAEPEENVRQIIENISGGKSGIQLPYLQVYLDSLWREDFARTYPGGWEAEGQETAYPPLEFTAAEIAELGEIEQVLESFLRQQGEVIQKRLQADFPKLPANAVAQVLDGFVTDEGTKQPLPYRREEGQLILGERFQARLKAVAPEAVAQILGELEQARILRFTDQLIELAHDSLAELIDRERSSEQRQLNQVRRRIAAAFVEQKESGVYLTARQLASLEDFLPRLELVEPLQAFIEASYADVAQKARAEKERQEKELRLAQEKLAAEQKARKRQRIFTIFIALALVVAIVAVVIAWRQQQTLAEQAQVLRDQQTELEAEKNRAEQALEQVLQTEAAKILTLVNNYVQRAQGMAQRGYPSESRNFLVRARDTLDNYPNNPFLSQRLSEVDSMLNR